MLQLSFQQPSITRPSNERYSFIIQVIHLIKTNQFYNINSSRNNWISKGWQVYSIWKQWLHICLWVWCPLNSGVLRLKHQSHIFTLQTLLQVILGTLNTFSRERCPLKELKPSPGRPALWGKQLKMSIQLLSTMQYTSHRSSAPELQRQSFKISFKHQNITLDLISLNQPGSFPLPLGLKCLPLLEIQNIPSVNELPPGIPLLFKS